MYLQHKGYKSKIRYFFELTDILHWFFGCSYLNNCVKVTQNFQVKRSIRISLAFFKVNSCTKFDSVISTYFKVTNLHMRLNHCFQYNGYDFLIYMVKGKFLKYQCISWTNVQSKS